MSRKRHARDIADLLSAVQSLAAQIASALYSEQIYERTLTHQRTAQELALAWQIQKSLLPDALPQMGMPQAVTRPLVNALLMESLPEDGHQAQSGLA